MVSDSAADTSQGDDAVQDEDSLPADDQNNENVRAADDAHVSEDVKDDDGDDQSDDDNQAEDAREDGEEVKSDEPAIPDLSSDGDDDRVSENVKDGDDDDQSDEEMESDENVQAADDSGQTDNLVEDEDDQDADNSFNEANQAEDDDQPAADTSQEDDAVQDEGNLPADADEQDNENVAVADDANVSEDIKEGDDEDQSDDDNQAENAQKGGEEDDEEDGQEAKADEPAVPDLSTDESDDEDKRRSKVSDDFVYDFDLMMAKKKEESYHRRKRKNIDIINDNDDIIAELITQMKQSADDDFELNKNRKAATCKLKLLPVLETQLRKIDLREAFLDAGVLGVITDWLTPLPDRSLPNLQVRETMLKLLGEFNIMDVERLKASGIGKAVMYLYKHPKETKENKKRAGALISSWSRPIFSLDSDFHTMSKEEREQRDFDHMTKLSENKRVRVEPKTPPSSSRKTQPEPEKTLRPGDKGWIPRARVPAPSTRDYVVRPKSNVDSEMTKSGSKKAITRLDKHLRNFREKKKLMKTQRAVAISIEGRRMSL